MCLAAAPTRQARRVRSAARTEARSLTAPVAGSERPSTAARISRGRRGGAQPLRKGYGQTEGLAVRGRLSPLLPNWRTEPIYRVRADANSLRSEEHTSELQSLMRISYAVFCLKKKKIK